MLFYILGRHDLSGLSKHPWGLLSARKLKIIVQLDFLDWCSLHYTINQKNWFWNQSENQNHGPKILLSPQEATTENVYFLSMSVKKIIFSVCSFSQRALIEAFWVCVGVVSFALSGIQDAKSHRVLFVFFLQMFHHHLKTSHSLFTTCDIFPFLLINYHALVI